MQQVFARRSIARPARTLLPDLIPRCHTPLLERAGSDTRSCIADADGSDAQSTTQADPPQAPRF